MGNNNTPTSSSLIEGMANECPPQSIDMTQASSQLDKFFKTIDISGITKLVKTANNTTNCDSECQKQKELETLYTLYVNAQQTLKRAPNDVISTGKKYYVTKGGDSLYQTTRTSEIQPVLDEKVAELTNNFNAYAEASQDLNDYNNYLVSEIKKKMKELAEFDTKKTVEKIILNDRGVYYKSQYNDTLMWRYRTYMFVYYLLAIVFLSMYIFYVNDSRRKKAFLTLGIVLYPFFVDRIVKVLKTIFYYILSYISSMSMFI